MVRADSMGAGHPKQADLRRTAQQEQWQVLTATAWHPRGYQRS